MAPNPNAWWSREIGRDLNRGMMELCRGSFESWRRFSPRERLRRLIFIVAVLAVECAVGYGLFVILKWIAK
jgi:hypothetical protein